MADVGMTSMINPHSPQTSAYYTFNREGSSITDVSSGPSTSGTSSADQSQAQKLPSHMLALALARHRVPPFDLEPTDDVNPAYDEIFDAASRMIDELMIMVSERDVPLARDASLCMFCVIFIYETCR